MKLHKIRKITRGGRLAAFLFAVISATAANAVETAVEYTTPASGTVSQSLADGKVQVVYDAEDKITRLAISPAAGETLTLCGDALPFADGAAIIPGADGESAISNAVSFAGAVSLGVKNISWTGSLSSSDYTTVFENANLDDISPVSATVAGTTDGLPEAGRPYFITRTSSGDTATMSVQFHTDWNGTVNSDNAGGSADQTKVVLVELVQDGANIKAKIIKSALYNKTRLHGFDIDGTQSTAVPTVSNKVKAYGISSLEFAPRYEYYFSNVQLGETETVVASGASLEDIEILYGLQSSTYGMMPYYVSYENGIMAAQLTQKFSSLGCVKIQLRQSGNDIVAKTVYAKNLTSWSQATPPDYDNEQTATTANISIKGLALRQKMKPRKLTFIASGETTLNAISGGNVDVTFKTLAANAPVPTTTASLFPAEDTWKTFATGVKLGELDLTGVVIGGNYAGSAFAFVDFANNGTTATFQAQGNGGTILRVINVQLQQSGDDVQLKIDTPYYTQDAAKIAEYYGVKSLPSSESGGNNSVASGDGVRGLNIKTLTYTITPTAFVYVTGANTLEDSSFKLIGGENRPLEFYVQHKDALPAGTTTASGDAGLYLEPKSATNWGGLQGGDAVVVMNPGSRLYQTVKEAFRCAGQAVTLDGATLYTRYDSGNVTPSEAYLNDVTLANGAAIMGEDSYMAGNPNRHSANPAWAITGTGAATCESTIKLVGSQNAGAGTYGIEIDVADTVAGDGADFIMDGDVTENAGSTYAHIIKKGAGTMQMNGVFRSLAEPTHVVEGTLLLGASGATAAGHGFSLDGGTLALADGTANTAGTLSATAESSLSVGSGASLTLADVAVSEGATLNVSGAGRTGVRVEATLSAATLSRIKVDGARAVQTDGYLRPARGFVISIH